MMKQAWALISAWRAVDIVEVLEVCHGCHNPNCKPFRRIWGTNAAARHDYRNSEVRA